MSCTSKDSSRLKVHDRLCVQDTAEAQSCMRPNLVLALCGDCSIFATVDHGNTEGSHAKVFTRMGRVGIHHKTRQQPDKYREQRRRTPGTAQCVQRE